MPGAWEFFVSLGALPGHTSRAFFGHHNVAPGSSQERSARGGAAAAVLGRYGGGWVAMGRGGEASGLAVVLREWRVGFEAVSARLRKAAF